MAAKSVEEQFAEEQARLAISQQYLDRDDNPDLDPTRQEQLDRNRIPGQLGEQQLSPEPKVQVPVGRPPSDVSGLPGSFVEALNHRPYRILGSAAVLGFVIGALWKS